MPIACALATAICLAATVLALVCSRISAARIAASEQRLSTILDKINTGIVIVDAHTHELLDVNPRALELLGAASREAVVGSVCHRHICPAEVGQCPVTDLHQQVDHAERAVVRVDGETVPVIKSVAPAVLGGRDVLIESFLDLTERKRLEAELQAANDRLNAMLEEQCALTDQLNEREKELEREAYTDGLTGLPNRRAFDLLLTEAVAEASRCGRPFALAIADLDHFKTVNDTFGHQTGDDVLIMISRIVRRSFRVRDFVFRYGGEEFAIIMREADERSCREACERARLAVQEETRAASPRTTLLPPMNITIGAAVCPVHAQTPADLVWAADAALYAGKNTGRNRVAMHHDRAESLRKVV